MAPPEAVSRISKAYLSYLAALTGVVGPATPFLLLFSKVVPSFRCHAEILMASATLGALILTALLLFLRLRLFRLLFPRGKLSLGPSTSLLIGVIALILIGAGFLIAYMYVLEETRKDWIEVSDQADVLNLASCSGIPARGLLLLYTGAFACFQLALLIMFFREYFQRILGVSDRDLLLKKQ